jgi:hypothetical protein
LGSSTAAQRLTASQGLSPKELITASLFKELT